MTTNKLDIRLTSACSYRVTLEQIGEKKMLDIRLHYARHLNKQLDHGHWRRLVRTNKLDIHLHYGRHLNKQSHHDHWSRLVRTNKLSVRLNYGRHPSKQSDHGEVSMLWEV